MTTKKIRIPGTGKPDPRSKTTTYRLCASKTGSEDRYELMRDEMTLRDAKKMWVKVHPTSVIQVLTSGAGSSERWLTVYPKRRGGCK